MSSNSIKRKNTQLESSGAEFLVLGNLLILGISAYKTYHNFKGYDLVAVNPDNNSSVKIQVKSRYQTDWDGFIIKDYDCDFVVFVALNRGYNTPKKKAGNGIIPPDYFVFPIKYVLDCYDKDNKWGKITKSRIKDCELYKNKWDLISEFLVQGKKYELLNQDL